MDSTNKGKGTKGYRVEREKKSQVKVGKRTEGRQRDAEGREHENRQVKLK